MSVERVFHCDWRECRTNVQTAGTRPPKFLTVTADAGAFHFCSWDCVLKHAAEIPPVELVPVEEA
jgi:hypothetical protein